MGNSDFTNDSIMEMYLFESTTLLEQLDEILLRAEKSGNLSSEDVNEIFRIMHTIKGSSAMMDFNGISFVAHKLEDLFFVIRDNGLKEENFADLFDLVLRVSDFLKGEVEKVQNQEELSPENKELMEEISNMLARMSGTAPEPKAEPVLKEEAAAVEEPMAPVMEEPEAEEAPPAAEEPQEAAPSGARVFHLHIRFMPDCQMENIRAYMVLTKMEALGKVLATIPEELNNNPDASNIIADKGFYLSFESDMTEQAVKAAALGNASVESCSFVDALPGFEGAGSQPVAAVIEPKQAPAAVEQEPAFSSPETEAEAPMALTPQKPAAGTPPQNGKDSAGDKGSAGPAKQNLINVDLTKLDSLMDLVGEIVITESMVSGCPDLAGLKLDNFNKAAHQLRKLMDELQDIVMSIRMIPIASSFHKMSRVVRDMCKKLDKDVDLVLMGESTEVDKTIIDGVAEPLMHLVRNAMDHGIEDKEARIAAGKDSKGTIILSAQNMGGDIIISISDDGKGIDPEVILRKAKERNLLTRPESEMTEREILNLLTLPGFSTKEAVTEFSGRGVGMDVVKKGVEKIGGTVTIESTKGLGTNIFFKIPLTLAIIASMEVKVGDNIYTIPISNIRESFKALPEQLLKDPDGNEMIMIRGVCYPIVRIHKLFHIEDAVTDMLEGILMLVDSGERLACIFADQLLGKHQVVVKPLPRLLTRYSSKECGVAGCTIMGDGSISLILDIQSILNSY